MVETIAHLPISWLRRSVKAVRPLSAVAAWSQGLGWKQHLRLHPCHVSQPREPREIVSSATEGLTHKCWLYQLSAELALFIAICSLVHSRVRLLGKLPSRECGHTCHVYFARFIFLSSAELIFSSICHSTCLFGVGLCCSSGWLPIM